MDERNMRLSGKTAVVVGAGRGWRIAVIGIGCYLLLVASIEIYGWVIQTEYPSTVRITTYDREGGEYTRVVALFEDGEEYFVASNHWFRRWYDRAIEQGMVALQLDGGIRKYEALEVSDSQEHQRKHEASFLGYIFWATTGFAPRKFIKLRLMKVDVEPEYRQFLNQHPLPES